MTTKTFTCDFERARLISHLVARVASEGIVNQNVLRRFVFDHTPEVTDAVFHDTLNSLANLDFLAIQPTHGDPMIEALSACINEEPTKYYMPESRYVSIDQTLPKQDGYNVVGTYEVKTYWISDHYLSKEQSDEMAGVVISNLGIYQRGRGAKIIHALINYLPPGYELSNTHNITATSTVSEQRLIPGVIRTLAKELCIFNYLEVKAYLDHPIVKEHLSQHIDVQYGSIVHRYSRLEHDSTPSVMEINERMKVE